MAVRINKSDNSEFRVTDKVYQGDNYLLKLNNTHNNLKLQSIVRDPIDILVGDRVDIELDKDKLVFIPEKQACPLVHN